MAFDSKKHSIGVKIDNVFVNEEALKSFAVQKEALVKDIEDKMKLKSALEADVSGLKENKQKLEDLKLEIIKEQQKLDNAKNKNEKLVAEHFKQITDENNKSIQGLANNNSVLAYKNSKLLEENKNLSDKSQSLNAEIIQLEAKLKDLKLCEGKLLDLDNQVKAKNEQLEDCNVQLNDKHLRIKEAHSSFVTHSKNLKDKQEELGIVTKSIEAENDRLRLVKENNEIEAAEHKKSLLADLEKRAADMTEREGEISKKETMYTEKVGQLRTIKRDLELYFNKTCPIII